MIKKMIKKVMLGLVAIAAISSCIKREDSLSTVQSTNVGSATLTGDVFAKTDYVGDTLTNGRPKVILTALYLNKALKGVNTWS